MQNKLKNLIESGEVCSEVWEAERWQNKARAFLRHAFSDTESSRFDELAEGENVFDDVASQIGFLSALEATDANPAESELVDAIVRPQNETVARIPSSFLNHAASVLADTDRGLSGSRIVEICNAWASDYDVDTPHSSYPFDAPNKRTALQENLASFPSEAQYELLLDLCDRFGPDLPAEVQDIRNKIIDRYSHFGDHSASSSITESTTQGHRHLLRVFLCHASDDKPRVKDLYSRLKNDGYTPWLDEVDLLPGQHWEQEIPKAVRQSHIVAVCLSECSITKEGYAQKEIKIALDVADEKPEGTIFIIPIRLEPCSLPARLQHLQCVDLFKKGAYNKLCAALDVRAAAVAGA